MRQYFNPRSPHGERPSQWRYEPGGIRISIHAPAWGATLITGANRGKAKEFQSTLPHGERLIVIMTAAIFGTFQSTLPHGERPKYPCSKDQRDKISIHAPAWGATILKPVPIALFKFQSTPPHGERPDHRIQEERPYYISIHAPAWGATSIWNCARRS